MTTELDRLLTPEPEYPRDDWSRGRNQLRESVRPEVEALQARVRELEGALKTALEHVEELTGCLAMSDPLTPDDLERMRAKAEAVLLVLLPHPLNDAKRELAEMAVRLLDEVERLRDELHYARWVAEAAKVVN